MIRFAKVGTPFIILVGAFLFGSLANVLAQDDEIDWWCYRHRTAYHLKLKCYEPITRRGEPRKIKCFNRAEKTFMVFHPTTHWEKLSSSNRICREKSRTLPEIPRGD